MDSSDDKDFVPSTVNEIDTSYEYHNVKLKAFEDEKRNVTRSFLEAKKWMKEGRLVVAYVHIPHAGDRCTSRVTKIQNVISGWKITTAKRENIYHIKSVQRPIKVIDVIWYIGGDIIENDPPKVMKAISQKEDAFITAEVTFKNGNYHVTSRVISICWDKRMFETEYHSRYKF